MELYARHGDLVIDKLDNPIAGELKKGTNIVFAGDSSGHPHTLVGEVMFRRDGRRTFVRVPDVDPTMLIRIAPMTRCEPIDMATPISACLPQ